MAEAKSRAAAGAAKMQDVLSLDPSTGKTIKTQVEVRHGGTLSTVMKHLGEVPCGTCRACCWHPRVDIQPDEDATGLETATRPDGGVAARRKEDGSCLHLGPPRCPV